MSYMTYVIWKRVKGHDSRLSHIINRYALTYITDIVLKVSLIGPEQVIKSYTSGLLEGHLKVTASALPACDQKPLFWRSRKVTLLVH